MGFLSDIGRARPVQAIQGFQKRESDLLSQEKNRAVADLNMQNVQQQMDIRQRQIDKGIADEKASLVPQAVETFAHKFEGGAESPMFQMVHEAAVANGLVDLTQGGLGTINGKTRTKIGEMMQDPAFMSKLSRTRIDYWRDLNTQAQQALADKPDDPKIQAELQRTTDGLNQSLGQDAAMSEHIKSQESKGFTLSQGQKRFDEDGKEIASVDPEEEGVGEDRFKIVGGKLVDLVDPDSPKVVVDNVDGEDKETLLDKGFVKTTNGLIDISDPKNPKFINNPKEETVTPSSFKKMIDERQALIDGGLPEDHPDVLRYDDKLGSGAVDITDLTPEEIDVWGYYIKTTGKVPPVGRGEKAAKVRIAMLKSASRQSLEEVTGKKQQGTQDSVDAAMKIVSSVSDTKSIQGSINFLDKQQSTMESFVHNMDLQIDRVRELSEGLTTFDTRLLNVPLRTVRSKIVGTPLQTRYDLLINEIELEMIKLASNATQSVALPSDSLREVFSRIHDKNLSVNDMIQVLEETGNAANMRFRSVERSLGIARRRMKFRDPVSDPDKETNNDPLGIR